MTRFVRWLPALLLGVVAATAVGCASPTDAQPTVTGGSGLMAAALADLPAEAATTVQLVASDGPFPYRQDGATFHNREGVLPPRPTGYYREYTVVTPGSPDRGARRIVAGAEGEMFYTDDHYATFREVIP